MKKLLAALVCSVALMPAAQAKVVDIYSPSNFQTVFTERGDVKVTFNVNATTLWTIPHMMILYVNRVEQKRVKYGSTNYFNVSGMPNGKYTINIGLEGIDKRMLFMSDPVTFNVKKEKIVVTE